MGGLDVKTAIERIIIKERIRKEVAKISELAEDIKLNGLINPVTVMTLDSGEYQLLAGLRRIRAVKSLGLSEIDINVITPTDAEAVLRIEVSENEQREEFTFTEKMDYARMFERLEKAKALERKSIGGKGGFNEDTDRGPYLTKGETRNIVGEKIGMSGRQYDRAKYISDNAPNEVIEQLDNGERTIRATYDELKAKKKVAAALPPDDSDDAEDNLPDEEAESAPAPQPEAPSKPHKPKRASEEEQMKLLSANDREACRKLKEFAALPPEGKVAELERQLFDMRVRANAAESDLETLRYEYGIKVDHKDSIIDSLKRQVRELGEALDAANLRIAELEK
jgi:ParB family chromosome partitioning protein